MLCLCRQEIEALEQRAHEAESARLAELEGREAELQAARKQLGALQADAERARDEVQQAHARVRKQEARLRKRSRHVDQTLHRFLNKVNLTKSVPCGSAYTWIMVWSKHQGACYLFIQIDFQYTRLPTYMSRELLDLAFIENLLFKFSCIFKSRSLFKSKVHEWPFWLLACIPLFVQDGSGDGSVNTAELRELIQSELQRLTERDTQRELQHQEFIQKLMQVQTVPNEFSLCHAFLCGTHWFVIFQTTCYRIFFL